MVILDTSWEHLLNQLTNKQRKVLHLISMGASYSEAAQLMSIDKSDVRRLIQRLDRRFRSMVPKAEQ